MARRAVLGFATLLVIAAGLPTLAGTSASASGASYTSLTFKPSIPIAAPGTLAAGAAAPVFEIVARGSTGQPVGGAVVDVCLESLFTHSQNGGTATATDATGTHTLTDNVQPNGTTECGPTQFTQLTAPSSGTSLGEISVQYNAPNPYPSPKIGRDVVEAQDPSNTTDTKNDFYVFSPVTQYVFSTSPIAPTGSLSSGQTVNLTVTAEDAQGNPIPDTYLNLSLTSTAAPSGTATATDICPTTNTTDCTTLGEARTRCIPPSPAGPCTSGGNPVVFFTGDGSNGVGVGQVNIAYTAGSATSGVDTITAQDHPTFTVENTDSYDYTAAGVFTPVNPTRICDTRGAPTPANQCNTPGAKTLGSGSVLNVQVTGDSINGGGTVPTSGVTAVVMNVTAINPSHAGYLTIYPTGVSTRPVVSNLNFPAGSIIANLVTVALGTGGQVSVYNFLGNVDVAMDIEGYYTTTTSGTTGEFVPIAPFRVCDTRSSDTSNQCTGHTLGTGGTLTINISSNFGSATNPLPACTPPSSSDCGVEAVVFNLTVVGATANTFVTAYPTSDSTRPPVSNVNVPAGTTQPNRVTVEVPTTGADADEVTFYNLIGSVDLVVDLNGWYNDGTASNTGYRFSPVVPERVCDTRYGSGCTGQPISGGTANVLNVPITGHAGVPATGAKAVFLNVTTVDSTVASYFTVYPGPAGASPPSPPTSDLNFTRGQVIPNAVVVELGSDGSINIYNLIGSSDAVVDVFGYFTT